MYIWVPGCLKAVKRKIDSEDLATHYRDDKVVGDWIRGYYAIPLLPAVNIREGWEYVGTFLPGVKAALPAEKRHKADIVHKYYKRFWIKTVGPARLSVHRQYNRTNNSAESWHSRINKGVGSKPKFWDYCEKIIEECQCFVDNYRRFQRGVRVTRPRPVTTTQIMIENATRKFEQDGDVGLFIRRCRHLAAKKAKVVVQDPEAYQPASQTDNPPSPPLPSQQNNPSPPPSPPPPSPTPAPAPPAPAPPAAAPANIPAVSQPVGGARLRVLPPLPASQPGPIRTRRNVREPAPYTPRATRAQRRQQAVAAAAEAVEEGPGAPEEDECNVCFVAKLNLRRPVIIVPCGHAKTCEACVDNLKSMNSHCPLCRTKIRSKTIAIL